MAIQPTQPQGIGGVLDTAFHLYKSSLSGVWPIALLLAIAGTVPNLYMMMTGGFSTGAGDLSEMMALVTNPAYWGASLVAFAVSMWAMGALYLKQYSAGVDGEMSVGAALQTALGRLVAFLVMILLFMVALSVGLLLLIIPGIILAFSLMLSTVLLLIESKGPVDALISSHKLVWGNWWRTVVVLSIGGILVTVLYLAIALVIGIITPLLGLGVDYLVLYSLISGLLIGALVNLLVTPFFSALLISLYWDLKLRKEGGDLAARVGALSAA